MENARLLVFAILVAVLVNGCSTVQHSNSYVNVEQSVAILRTNGEYSSADLASQAVDSYEIALEKPDLKPRERESIIKKEQAARESFEFLEFIDNSWSRYGPGINSKDPYVNESALCDYLTAILAKRNSINRPAYKKALDKHLVNIERQSNEISRRIRELEQQYSYNLTQLQFDFIQQAAKNDILFARYKYNAGKKPWWLLDDKDLIAQGLRPVRRVEATPRVHASIRADAESVDRQICSSLSDNRITREMQKPRLSDYELEYAYPSDTQLAKRTWVTTQWEPKQQLLDLKNK